METKERIKKIPLIKRKIFLWATVIFLVLFLGIVQAQNISEKWEKATNFPFKETFSQEKKESQKEAKELFHLAKEELNKATNMTEEEIVEILIEEGVIEKEDIDNIMSKKGIKEGELIKLIEKKE